jgi:hypothetical protein
MNVTMSFAEDAFDTLRVVIIEIPVLGISSPSRKDGIFFSNHMGFSGAAVFVRWLRVELMDERSFALVFELEMRHFIRVTPSSNKKEQKKQQRKTPCSNRHGSASIQPLIIHSVGVSHNVVYIATSTRRNYKAGAINTIVIFNQLWSKERKGCFRTLFELIGVNLTPHFKFSGEFIASLWTRRSSTGTGSI